MRDTTLEMEAMQLKIIFSKTAEERFKMGVEMIDFAYQVTRNNILAENPSLYEREVTAELFKRYYGDEFSENQIKEITEGILNFIKK